MPSTVLPRNERARSGTTCWLPDLRARSPPACSSNAILFPSARTCPAQNSERACISVRRPKPLLNGRTHGNIACSLVSKPFAGIRARSRFAVVQCAVLCAQNESRQHAAFSEHPRRPWQPALGWKGGCRSCARSLAAVFPGPGPERARSIVTCSLDVAELA